MPSLPAPAPAQYLHTGQWSAAAGFFNLDERLSAVVKSGKSGLTLPLAPRPIMMPEYPLVNSTVLGLFSFMEAHIREIFIGIFRGCQHSPGLLFVDTGSNEGAWSMLAAAHGCKVVAGA